MTTPTDTPWLRLLWLASPALPVGGFSYSEGLEAAVDAGLVQGETQAGDWLLAQLQLVMARAESPVVAQALPAWQAGDLATVTALNDWVLHTRESSEQRLQAEQMGRSLVAWLLNGEQAGDARIAQAQTLPGGPTWPVAWALAAALAGADTRQALLAHGFGWAENLVQAAMKAVPLGQAAAQRMLARLAQALPAAVDQALACGPAERQAFAPMLAILSARHEAQYSRLFRS
jgi:urease accessory protein